MSKFLFSLLLSCCSIGLGCSQEAPPDRPALANPELDQELTNLLGFTVPLIGVRELRNIQAEVHIFDTRDEEEFNISHIPGATHVGYNTFDLKALPPLAKTDTIVLYCSVGYRSEKIGEKLKKMGYTQVFNLYGSLFEWANRQYPLVDKNGKPTRKIHTYNRSWSQWVDETKAERVW